VCDVVGSRTVISMGVPQAVSATRDSPRLDLSFLTVPPDSIRVTRCPACRTEIRLPRDESRPDPQAEYRCHVCRLDLRFDGATSKMILAPFKPDHHVETSKPRSRKMSVLVNRYQPKPRY
jgi:hypothetical protein